MSSKPLRKGKIVHILFIFLALVIILDFIIPGKAYTDTVIDIERARQQYYNAAGNYHYSYKLFTTKHSFFVSEEFAQVAQEKQEIQYRVSLFFREVNRYSLVTSERKNVYILRTLSGLMLPIVTIIILVLGYKYENKIGTLVFVAQALLVANLIFLII